MKCKECLNIIEEYVEGELDERTAGFITVHIAGCAACTKVYDKLQREQEIYAGFLSEVKESPALWAAVRASIERESGVYATQPAVPTRSWFSGLLSYPRFSVVLALTLLIIGISIGLMRLLSSHRSPTDDLAVASKRSQAAPSPQNPINPGDRVTAGTQVKASDKTDQTPPKRNRQRDGLSRRLLMADSNFRRNNNTKPVLAQLPSEPSNPEKLLALNAEMNDAEQRRLKFSSLLDRETARHLEKSEMMLRSLRNAIRENEAPTSNISYERRLSQELLNKNILLRRNAAARGDVLSENLLSRLEPFLLDITNLEDKPSATDLRLLDERIRQKEIIATLQAYIG